MKFPSKEEFDRHSDATLRGSIEGIIAGLAIALPGSYLLHRRSVYYRSLPVTIKALGVVLVVAPAFAVQAERRGVEYDESTWTGAGKLELERERLRRQARWDALSGWQKVGDFASRHQTAIILGCWAASMAGSWTILARNKTQSFAQKIVQARVYAQGATVATLLGAAVLTQSQRREAAAHKGVDHSWQTLLQAEDQVAEEAHAQKLSATA